MYVYLITLYIRKPTPTLNEWISHVIQRNYFSIDLFNFENMVDWFNAVKGELKIYPGISLTWRNSQYRRATFRFHSKSDVYSHFRPSVNRNRSYIFFLPTESLCSQEFCRCYLLKKIPAKPWNRVVVWDWFG